MRTARLAVITATALLCAAVATPSLAHGFRHGPRVSFSFGFGAPYYPYGFGYYPHYPRAYYPYYPYYAAPVVVAPATVPTYVEQGGLQAAPAPQAPAQSPSSYWYYCAESNAYYPYVKQCAGAWQPVSPTPPGR